jgi:hypothetical protein
MERLEPSLAYALTDIDDPNVNALITESFKHEPIATLPIADTLLPTRKNFLIDKLLPVQEMSITDMAEPNRANVLKLNELPSSPNLNIDKLPDAILFFETDLKLILLPRVT